MFKKLKWKYLHWRQKAISNRLLAIIQKNFVGALWTLRLSKCVCVYGVCDSMCLQTSWILFSTQKKSKIHWNNFASFAWRQCARKIRCMRHRYQRVTVRYWYRLINSRSNGWRASHFDLVLDLNFPPFFCVRAYIYVKEDFFFKIYILNSIVMETEIYLVSNRSR